MFEILSLLHAWRSHRDYTSDSKTLDSVQTYDLVDNSECKVEGVTVPAAVCQPLDRDPHVDEPASMALKLSVPTW